MNSIYTFNNITYLHLYACPFNRTFVGFGVAALNNNTEMALMKATMAEIINEGLFPATLNIGKIILPIEPAAPIQPIVEP